MNKIINGKRYDTETAEYIGESDEIRWRKEILYKKHTGEFFIMRWTAWQGEKDIIVPLEIEEAKDWVAENMDADEYQGLFGPVDE